MVLLASCNRPIDGQLILAENGKSNYEIVFMGNATKSQYQSAEILSDYIKMISGAEVSVVDESSQSADIKKIYIGNIKEEHLEIEQISIQEDNGNIIVSGQSDVAIRNAVYVFLEKYFDCKWYAPGVEVIPEQSVMTIVSPDYSYTPKVTTRTVHWRLANKARSHVAQGVPAKGQLQKDTHTPQQRGDAR